jgi:glycosyltransferase involved in cell wall biosynthesis
MQPELSSFVSVIIPTYNRSDFLAEAIQSVQNQSYKHFEIIVVDDGSTDTTPAVCERPGVTYIRLPHSGFPGQVRNEGVLKAKGEWLAFLDSDDIWLEHKLTRQIQFFKENPTSLLCHTREIWQRDGRIVSQASQKQARSGSVLKDALKKCIIGPSTVMLQRKLFIDAGMFNPALEIAEDYELWLRICARYPVGYIDDPLIIKRGGHQDQLSGKYGHIEIFRITALWENIKNNTFKAEDLPLVRQELVSKCLIYARGCQKRGKIEEADHFFTLARHQANYYGS